MKRSLLKWEECRWGGIITALSGADETGLEVAQGQTSQGAEDNGQAVYVGVILGQANKNWVDRSNSRGLMWQTLDQVAGRKDTLGEGGAGRQI